MFNFITDTVTLYLQIHTANKVFGKIRNARYTKYGWQAFRQTESLIKFLPLKLAKYWGKNIQIKKYLYFEFSLKKIIL